MVLLLNKLGGTNLEDRGDKTALSEEHTLTWEKMLDAGCIGHAVNANKTLKAAGAYENGGFTAAENYTTADGIQGTVNSIELTSPIPGGDSFSSSANISNEANAFDTNPATSATWNQNNISTPTEYITSTFTERYIEACYIDLYVTRLWNDLTINLQTYNGTTWTTKEVVLDLNNYPDGGGDVRRNFKIPVYLDIQGIRLQFVGVGGNSGADWTTQIYSFVYGDFITNAEFETNSYICKGGSGSYVDSEIECDTGITIGSSDSGICLYSDQETPTDTNITVDLTDGVSTISDIPITNGTSGVISKGSLSGDLTIIWKLNTTDTAVTPIQYGWGVYKI